MCMVYWSSLYLDKALKILSSVLLFHSEVHPLEFLIGKSLWCTLAAFWESLHSSFIFERQFCWIWNFWLTDFSFGPLKLSSHSLLVSLVSDEKSVHSPKGLLCMMNFSFANFKILFLSLALDDLNIKCLSVGFIMFILLGVYWTSRRFRLFYFIKYGKFLTTASPNILSAPFSLSS